LKGKQAVPRPLITSERQEEQDKARETKVVGGKRLHLFDYIRRREVIVMEERESHETSETRTHPMRGKQTREVNFQTTRPGGTTTCYRGHRT